MAQYIEYERKQEIVAELREVQSTFAEAWEQLAELVRELGDRHAEAYLVEQLQTLIFKEHGFVTRDMSIEAYADDLENADTNDEEE